MSGTGFRGADRTALPDRAHTESPQDSWPNSGGLLPIRVNELRAGSDRTGTERSAPNQRRIDPQRLAYFDQTLVQCVQTGAMM